MFFGFKKLFGVLLFPLTAIPPVNHWLMCTACWGWSWGRGREWGWGPSTEPTLGLLRKGTRKVEVR